MDEHEQSTRKSLPINLEVEVDNADESLDLRDSRTIPFVILATLVAVFDSSIVL